MKSTVLISLIFTLLSFASSARVYKNVTVGDYQAVINLNDYMGQPFLNVMKDVIYPQLNEQAANRSGGRHLDGIRAGEGVELILTDDVTTYHVKYFADTEGMVERSGRSFGAVGAGQTKKYIADASYKHYLRSLEAILKGSDSEVEAFFTAIISVMTNSDASAIDKLDIDSKQVAADFVAIYVAEQYRRLSATKGESLGRSHRWDNALVQVTLLSAFHSGQDEMAMFYEGEFTNMVFHQDACLYRAPKDEDMIEGVEKRQARLYDYWQFTVRSECPGRSGVNLTRRDFEKLGKTLTAELNDKTAGYLKELELGKDYDKNFFKAVTKELLNGTFIYVAEDFTGIVVDVLMSLRRDANAISASLKE